ncbi:putative Ig domain-containing protein [Comamonas testosteroni]|uniref:RCC1 domain-containing protein n=1 Tax=Comamonas testosteroni TaxID=285 RepID=UPI0026E98DAB|nr:putative Ig domain-containing protein [Comamonas testosteroni]
MKLRPTPRHLFALSLLTLAAHAGAASYYILAPLKTARSAAAVQAQDPPADPNQGVTVSLNAFTPPPGAEGAPYSLDLRSLTQVSGASLDTVTYSIAGGALPEGLTLASNGLLSGTPATGTPAEGQLVTIQASYGTKTAQQTYLFSMEAMSITLASATLPEAKVGKAYSFDFKSLATVKGGTGISNATFQRQGAALPADLTLGTDGVLSGTPTEATTGSGTSFTVVGNYLSKTGQQVYTIKVGEAVLEAVQIAAGGFHSCAVTTAGAVKCWGYNSDGQLGDGTTTSQNTPVAVSGLGGGVASVTGGTSHTCAVTTAGAVKCWGNNGSGQLGDGTTTSQNTPVAVSGLGGGVASVTGGTYHSCAVTTAGAVKCWGYISDGQLGDATTTQRNTPVAVSGLGGGVASVTSGYSHTCAITTAGAVKCWGYNSDGQLGDGTAANRATPVNVKAQ